MIGVDRKALLRALAWADEREDEEQRFRDENDGEHGGIYGAEDRAAADEIRLALLGGPVR